MNDKKDSYLNDIKKELDCFKEECKLNYKVNNRAIEEDMKILYDKIEAFNKLIDENKRNIERIQEHLKKN
jgi:hypothetical protein